MHAALRGLAVVLVVAGGCATRPTAPVKPPAAPTSVPAKPEPAVVTIPPGPQPSSNQPASSDPAPKPPPRPVTVAAVGDIMLGTDFPENRLPEDGGASILDGVAATLASADVTFGNLEGTLMNGGEPFKACSNPAACYLFRSPEHYVGHLVDAGFDVVSVANNHSRDFGDEGLDRTMLVLGEAGILSSGRFGTIASWRIDTTRLALIAFSTGPKLWPLLEIDVATTEVRRLARAHDIVIVSFHGGGEGPGAMHVPFAAETYYGQDRGDVVAFARAVVDAGADLVLGHGPHVPRAIERYRDRLIAYSLGNFATWYGFSIVDEKGLAPILVARLDGDGRFLGGRIVSARQSRPEGTELDPSHAAAQLIRRLTREDFAGGDLFITDEGRLLVSAPPVADSDAPD